MTNQIIRTGYDETSFSRDVISMWGNSIEGLRDNVDLLHPQMFELGRAVVDSCESGSTSIGQEILEFVSNVLAMNNAISEIENAVAISFISNEELDRISPVVSVPNSIVNLIKPWGN